MSKGYPACVWEIYLAYLMNIHMNIQILNLLLAMGLFIICSCKRKQQKCRRKDMGPISAPTMLFYINFQNQIKYIQQTTMQQKQSNMNTQETNQEQKARGYESMSINKFRFLNKSSQTTVKTWCPHRIPLSMFGWSKPKQFVGSMGKQPFKTI